MNACRYLLALPAMLIAVALSLTGLFASGADAAWPGRNGPIVYAALDPGTKSQPYLAAGLRAFDPAVLGARSQPTSEPGDFDPQVSPDGRLIVFSRTVRPVPGEPEVTAVFVVGVDGSGLRQVTEGGGIEPTFYPSGRRIAFVRASGPQSRGDIYSVGLDGSGLRRLTVGSVDDGAPTVSPTGRQIAFECSGFRRHGLEFSDEHICSIRPDGSHRRDLTPRFEHGQTAAEPDFSPSGHTIAFTVGPGIAADVFTMRANGARLGALTNRGPRGGRIFPREVGYNEPAFAPAGDSIVAVARTGLRPRFVRIRLDDPDSPRVLDEGALGRQPTWAPAPPR